MMNVEMSRNKQKRTMKKKGAVEASNFGIGLINAIPTNVHASPESLHNIAVSSAYAMPRDNHILCACVTPITSAYVARYPDVCVRTQSDFSNISP